MKTPKNKPLSITFLYKKATVSVINSVLENQLQVLVADDPIRTELNPINIEIVGEGEMREKELLENNAYESEELEVENV